MKYPYGGQALIEGVMMNGRENSAIAVRKADGTISVKMEKLNRIGDKYKFLKWPFIRGSVNLVESMVVGFKALTHSANESAEYEEEVLEVKDIILSVAIALVLGVGLFFVLPVVLAHLLTPLVESSFWQNMIEGLIRVGVFLIYVIAISRMKEIARVFQYHGAEHKTIHAYEHDRELIPANCQEYTTLHPRCGTSFLFIVMIISIIVFSFLGVENFWWRVTSRVILLPVVAGISYEFLKFTSRHMDNKLVKAAAYPGLMLQKLTTKKPDEEMLEVAIVALKKVREKEENIPFEPLTSPVEMWQEKKEKINAEEQAVSGNLNEEKESL